MTLKLRDFEEHYNPDTIQLIFGQHIISIDTNVCGSLAIIRAFLDYTFDLEKYDENHKHLILRY